MKCCFACLFVFIPRWEANVYVGSQSPSEATVWVYLLFPMFMCVSLLSRNKLISPASWATGSFQAPNASPSACDEESTSERRTQGKYRPFGFLRIGIYMLGLVWMYPFFTDIKEMRGLIGAPCKVRGELISLCFSLFCLHYKKNPNAVSNTMYIL